MPAYDASLFDPPAPLAQVTLRIPGDGTSVSGVPMLLDSGADVTLVQRSSVDQLGAIIDSNTTYEVYAFDGTVTFAQSVELDLVFLDRSFRGRFLTTDEGVGILGETFSIIFLSYSTDQVCLGVKRAQLKAKPNLKSGSKWS
jgi:hypothetical protein